ncbi:MAG: hypothetical protein R3E68_10365 [Burkholderiaceae bacterium]
MARQAVGVFVSVGMLGSALAQDMSTSFDDRWVKPGETLEITLPEERWASQGRLRYFIGKTDVTALARSESPGKVSLDSSLLALPPGETEFIVYEVTDGNWEEYARTELKVLTGSGFEKLEVSPTVALQLKGRSYEKRLVPDDDQERSTYLDVVGDASLGVAATRGDLEMEATANFSGYSYRPETLRFGELEDRAPKLDLADYNIEVRTSRLGMKVGHVSYGNHPLLLDQMSSRGFIFTGRPTDRFDMSLNVMNGTSIVGYNNFWGLRESDHRIHGLTMGYELVGSRPGALRTEVSLMQGSIQSQTDFNAGAVPDAERSRGVGLRVVGASEGGRITGDVSWARSVYVNPFDPLLAQGETLQPVFETRSSGRVADLGIGLIQNSTMFSEKHPFGLKLSLHHDRIDPLYKSLGAFFATDQLLNRVGLDADMAGATLSLSAARKRDNLSNIPTLLTTRSDTRIFNLNLPIPVWMSQDENDVSGWWPSLNYNYSNVHQVAISVPVTEDSGFADSHRPDQQNKDHQLSFSWNLSPVTLTYGLNYSDQDNRQQGRDRADFKNYGQQISANWDVFDGLNTTLGLGRTRLYSVEADRSDYANDITLGADWAFANDWNFGFSVNKTLNSDSLNSARNRNAGGHAQLGYQFEIKDGLRKMPGQIFVRYGRQDSLNVDNIFEIRDAQRYWHLDVGFSISLF